MSYNKTIYDVFHMVPAPRGIIADLVMYDGGAYYAIRLYRDNFDSRSESTRVAATEWALETAERMKLVVPVTIEAWETPPEDK